MVGVTPGAPERSNGMRMIGTGIIAASLAASPVAWAAGDALEGQRVAQTWCTGCHVVGASGADMAPTFAEIAGRPGRTEDWLYVWLTDPHPPMPQLDLSRQDIANIIAYLQSLRPAR
jgi:mono/diheme cytochrome c family protein